MADAEVLSNAIVWVRLAAGCESLPPGVGSMLSRIALVLERLLPQGQRLGDPTQERP